MTIEKHCFEGIHEFVIATCTLNVPGFGGNCWSSSLGYFPHFCPSRSVRVYRLHFFVGSPMPFRYSSQAATHYYTSLSTQR